MSKKFFNEVEALKIAQNMERHGIAFYEKAAAASPDESTRKVLLELAEDEKKHLARFEEIEEKFQAHRRDGGGYADDEDLRAYIDRLIGTQVFADEGDVARLAEQTDSDYEALGVGMRAERDSIVFYQEMIDFVDSPEAKEAFGQILNEERRHLQILGERSEHCENYEA